MTVAEEPSQGGDEITDQPDVIGQVVDLLPSLNDLIPSWQTLKSEIVGIALGISILKFDLSADITENVKRGVLATINRLTRSLRSPGSPGLRTAQQKTEDRISRVENKSKRMHSDIGRLKGRVGSLERSRNRTQNNVARSPSRVPHIQSVSEAATQISRLERRINSLVSALA